MNKYIIIVKTVFKTSEFTWYAPDVETAKSEIMEYFSRYITEIIGVK